MVEYTTVINHTYDEIQANRRQLNIIDREVSTVTATIAGSIDDLKRELALHRHRIDVDILVSELDHRYTRAHGGLLRRKESLEEDRLTKSLLSPSLLHAGPSVSRSP